MSQTRQIFPVGTHSVIRAFYIFEKLCESQKGKRIRELSQETGLNKSTIFRILTTLRNLGYIDQNEENGVYYATMKILALSSGLLSGMEIRSLALPAMQKLVAQTKQAVHLSVRDADKVVIIEKIETDAYIRVVSHVGRRSNMYSTGTGKIFLAFLPEKELNTYFERTQLNSLTPHTLCNTLRLLEELKEIREQGYAVDRQENALGISCIAVSIFDYSGKNVAAISLTGTTTEIEPAVHTLKSFVCEAGESISRSLGYR